MELINSKEITKIANLQKFGGEKIARFLMSVFKLDKINKIYSNHYQKPAVEFLENVMHDTGVNYHINENDLNKIPKSGPFIIVANHPYGGLDGMMLLHIMLQVRPDIKVMGNFLLHRIEPLKNYVVPVNPFEQINEQKQNISSIKYCLEYLNKGKPVAIFPAGEVSTYQQGISGITDKKWNKGIIKFINKAKVPVVPFYFQGTNSNLFHWLGLIHPSLRTAKIPSELLNKKNKTIQIRIGSPISVTEQELFEDTYKLGNFLRAKTYSLGSFADVNKFFKKGSKEHLEEIIDTVPTHLLLDDLEKLPGNCLLFTLKNYRAYIASTVQLPNIINEIGRLRELTFREVGEGTNNALDIDEYDLHYKHLFIWDVQNHKIVGGYRAGMGKDIINQYGLKGFYTRSLFKMDKKITPYLSKSIELGRSFIVNEYQRKPLSLFLLWKAILLLLLKSNDYRFLVGPVSISNNFSSMSQQLIVDFIHQNFRDKAFGKLLQPRNPFVPPIQNLETSILTEEITNINHLETIIRDIEITGNRIPVLLKKYLSLGGKIAAFNVDPNFNNSLDGFLVLDVADIPKDMVQTLSKDINDESIIKRFVF